MDGNELFDQQSSKNAPYCFDRMELAGSLGDLENHFALRYFVDFCTCYWLEVSPKQILEAEKNINS
jgi:hypothetical protein